MLVYIVLLCFSVPHPLVVGYPHVHSPWGEGSGKGRKISIFPFSTPLFSSGVVDFKFLYENFILLLPNAGSGILDRMSKLYLKGGN